MIVIDPKSQTTEDSKKYSRKILKPPLRVSYSVFHFI